jgi:hypothetical protein
VHRLPLALTAVLTVLLASAVPSHAAEIRGADGAVSAVLKYTSVDGYKATGLRLTITREGAVVWDKRVAVNGCGQPFCRPGDVTVKDLDADGEPEILVDVFTGGAHCCTIAQLFTWQDGTYSVRQRNFRDPGYGIDDLDADGRPELVSSDARFAYTFGSYAAGGMPLQIWQVDGGRFVDVTAGHPDALRADAKGWYAEWKRRRGKPAQEPLAPLSAWVADMERLGEHDAVERELQRALRRGWLTASKPWTKGRRYLRDLDRFLKATGYRQ